ncbi:phosphate regulon sensor histidine kinase PhoR [Halomonas piscis]|uniref:Phosphate regulon sensor protein PhoR n=1 Tax=Halomonas piscis TaxID=3031727 RepID=A0ABY9Z203_9GAMM|nr:phosphate regulon sensor histidine kinase PhoR [Halomonas piscis]WNK20299.1 phosphate regulon sensor histidine kinase PhoR [Halomonas piscis]
MTRLWLRELWRLGMLCGLGVLLGWLFSAVGAGLAAALGVYLFYQLRQLHALHQQLSRLSSNQPLVSGGVWDDLFDRLYRYQKAQQTIQRRLRDTLSRIKDSSEAMRDSVVMLDRHGYIEWRNSAAERMLGLKPAKGRHQHITHLLRAPHFVDYFHALDYREPLTLISPIDEQLVLQCQITLNGNGERLLMARDITRLHRLEQIRRDFVANVSHELRTPLTVLTGYLEIYQDIAEVLPSRLECSLPQMQKQTARMQNLVDDLLLLSRLESNDRSGEDARRLNLASMLETIRRDAEALSDSGQRITLEIHSTLDLMGCEQELQSAISNLAFNAVRYSGSGSQIVLRWRALGDGACVEVQDDGEGIAAIHIPRLTERFYRVDKGRSTATGGTGLGLAIVKHVLLRHEARLEIDSQLGQGATFRCVFPHQLVVASSS